MGAFWFGLIWGAIAPVTVGALLGIVAFRFWRG